MVFLKWTLSFIAELILTGLLFWPNYDFILGDMLMHDQLNDASHLTIEFNDVEKLFYFLC